MTLVYTKVIFQTLWAEPCSTAVHIKHCLPHSAFELKKLPYEIKFSNRPSIKHLYSFVAKYSIHVPEEIQTGIFTLSPREIKCDVIGYTKLSKILRLYDLHQLQVFTSRDVVFADSTKLLE
jgi:hypothetical protein